MKSLAWKKMLMLFLLLILPLALSGCIDFGTRPIVTPNQPTLALLWPDASPLEQYLETEEVGPIHDYFQALIVYVLTEMKEPGQEEGIADGIRAAVALAQGEGEYVEGVWTWTDETDEEAELTWTAVKSNGGYDWTLSTNEEVVGTVTTTSLAGTQGLFVLTIPLEESEELILEGSWSTTSATDSELEITGEFDDPFGISFYITEVAWVISATETSFTVLGQIIPPENEVEQSVVFTGQWNNDGEGSWIVELDGDFSEDGTWPVS